MAILMALVPLVSVAGPAWASLPSDEAPIWHLVPDLTSKPSPSGPGSVPDHPAIGNQIVLHLRCPEGCSSLYNVAVVRDDQGHELLSLWLDGRTLYGSDGYQPDGVTPRPFQQGGIALGTFNRLDIQLEGDAYTVRLDRSPAVTLATYQEATVGTAYPGQAGLGTPVTDRPADVEGLRHYPADARLTTFDQPLSNLPGWSAVVGDGTLAVEPDDASHLGWGRLAVEAPGTLTSVTYAHTPVDGLGDLYVTEVDFRPKVVSVFDPDGVPDHQAVLAGLSGSLDEPTVHWALVMAQDGVEHDRWHLYLIDEDGFRTPVSPRWRSDDPRWHTARVLVDEQAGALTVEVDGAPAALRFEDAFTGGGPDRLAVGDLWQGGGQPWWSGGGTGYYDHVAVVPWEADP